MKIVMLSTFGPEVRGISYYSDSLLLALREPGEADVVAEDYLRIYPDWLYPAQRSESTRAANRHIHYARPGTWCVRTPNPDVIHLQSWTFATALIHQKILRQARAQAIPTVLTLHNPVSHERFGFFRGAQRRCLDLADRIVIHDACGLSAIPKSLHSKVRVIAHGTDPVEIGAEALRAALDQPPTLLCFGNIRPYKGIELLLEAWQLLADEFPDLRLIVAGRLWRGSSPLSSLAAHLLGTARQARRMERLAADPALQRVAFRFEFIPDDELDTLIRNARYTVFPYLKFSGHSGALARSVSQGTPALVSDVGGLPSLAIGPDYVFKAGARNALVALLRQRLNATADPLAERQAQLRVASNFSWTHAAAEHMRLYRELIGDGAVPISDADSIG